MVYAGDYEVNLNFKGKITRDMTGLYPCFFKNKNKEQVLLATQFESHYARDVFPCIDEPEAKATFRLTLITPPGLQLLSNTPIENQATLPDSMMSTSFETTPPMSPYLLAFVIGNLHNKSTKTKRGTEVGVWATIVQPLAALDFALDVARRSIEFFEDYFGVPYPLAKIDHVAVPDFSSGAMENWGLVTYRERVLWSIRLLMPYSQSGRFGNHLVLTKAYRPCAGMPRSEFKPSKPTFVILMKSAPCSIHQLFMLRAAGYSLCSRPISAKSLLGMV
jgi:aminopeptidase N